MLLQGEGKEDAVQHDGVRETPPRTAAGLEKPVGFAQHSLTALQKEQRDHSVLNAAAIAPFTIPPVVTACSLLCCCCLWEGARGNYQPTGLRGVGTAHVRVLGGGGCGCADPLCWGVRNTRFEDTGG